MVENVLELYISREYVVAWGCDAIFDTPSFIGLSCPYLLVGLGPFRSSFKRCLHSSSFQLHSPQVCKTNRPEQDATPVAMDSITVFPEATPIGPKSPHCSSACHFRKEALPTPHSYRRFSLLPAN